MIYKLLLSLLMATSCFAAQNPPDSAIPKYEPMPEEYIPESHKAHILTFKISRTTDPVLKLLTNEQLIALMQQFPIEKREIGFAYAERLREIARQQKLISHEVDCDALGTSRKDPEMLVRLNAQHRRFERNQGESTKDWNARVKKIVNAEEIQEIARKENQKKIERVKQLKGYAWTGFKIVGGLAVVSSLVIAYKWHQKKKISNQDKEKESTEKNELVV